ncbi:hypothetical protein AMJ44_13250 [candidate division WOR-1 bacterium DG_54_3]|uniref:Uncharacterized protein n=1 Tax=candidate division WOR-1 bacterium DG_54_3 TaxID=1703775 RepID=A0A0S7XNU8_UNCSA|nr:MAG: hypothetical protein AMJ44_13250 [candidate division WOR-1 bacterium DG_54_3]
MKPPGTKVMIRINLLPRNCSLKPPKRHSGIGISERSIRSYAAYSAFGISDLRICMARNAGIRKLDPKLELSLIKETLDKLAQDNFLIKGEEEWEGWLSGEETEEEKADTKRQFGGILYHINMDTFGFSLADIIKDEDARVELARAITVFDLGMVYSEKYSGKHSLNYDIYTGEDFTVLVNQSSFIHRSIMHFGDSDAEDDLFQSKEFVVPEHYLPTLIFVITPNKKTTSIVLDRKPYTEEDKVDTNIEINNKPILGNEPDSRRGIIVSDIRIVDDLLHINAEGQIIKINREGELIENPNKLPEKKRIKKPRR